MSCNCCLGESIHEGPFCDACKANAVAILGVSDAPKLNCFRCKNEFKRETLTAHGGFCGRCANSMPIAVTKRKAPNAALRRTVWERYMGTDRARAQCYCCGSGPEIDIWDFECGHVEAFAKNGELTVDNLRPICGVCNRSMGTQNMLEFVRVHRYRSEMARRELGITYDEFVLVPVPEPVAPKKEKHGHWPFGGTRPECALS